MMASHRTHVDRQCMQVALDKRHFSCPFEGTDSAECYAKKLYIGMSTVVPRSYLQVKEH